MLLLKEAGFEIEVAETVGGNQCDGDRCLLLIVALMLLYQHRQTPTFQHAQSLLPLIIANPFQKVTEPVNTTCSDASVLEDRSAATSPALMCFRVPAAPEAYCGDEELPRLLFRLRSPGGSLLPGQQTMENLLMALPGCFRILQESLSRPVVIFAQQVYCRCICTGRGPFRLMLVTLDVVVQYWIWDSARS
jgi:hypothetical protein